MWRWINSQFAAMEAMSDFDAAYFNQSGDNVKKLIEEAIPVALLTLRFVAPMEEVLVRVDTGSPLPLRVREQLIDVTWARISNQLSDVYGIN